MKINQKLLSIAVIVSFFSSAGFASAFCPICTVAVAGGVGLSRWLGIDDTVTGIWIGALTVSMIMWTNNWLKKRGVKVWGYQAMTTILYYFFIFIPFYKYEILGHKLNKFWGIDKLVLGTVVGTFAFWGGTACYSLIKKKNSGKAHFPFQKIVVSLLPVIALSAIFYLITR